MQGHPLLSLDVLSTITSLLVFSNEMVLQHMKLIFLKENTVLYNINEAYKL